MPVIRLSSVTNGGTGLDLDASTMDMSRSRGYGRTVAKPSYRGTRSSSRIDGSGSKVRSHGTFAEPYACACA